MKIKTIILFLIVTSNIIAQTPKISESIHINGKDIYYEVYGEGDPLFLFHGYTQSSVSWKPYIKDFEADFAVYLVDLTGHGRSEPFKEDLSIKSVAMDVKALVGHLQLSSIKAIGFSFGGDVLYQLALIDPDLIESMITIGAVGTWSINDFPNYLEAFTFDNRAQFPWLKDSHKSADQIKGVMGQFKNYVVELSDEELKSIKPEVLIMIGDDDEGMSFDEVARAKKFLPKSDLWILPNVAHGAHEGETKDDFIIKSKAFFSKM